MGLMRKACAEALGTALLLAVVVGSGIMGQQLAGGNVAVALLANSVATGTALVVLITLFAPISGAHFNPVVTLVMVLLRQMGGREPLVFVLAQCAGSVLGVGLAHAMFGQELIQVGTHLRDGLALAEAVATFGLIATILGIGRSRPDFVPMAVGLYITSAYWFTASTSFANPAVTLARCLTDSFAGIAPASVPAFMAAQVAGALVGFLVMRWLMAEQQPPCTG